MVTEQIKGVFGMSVENPGSLNDFAERSGLEVNSAWPLYVRELDDFRRHLAESLGITLDELHEFNFPHTTSDKSTTDEAITTQQIPELI